MSKAKPYKGCWESHPVYNIAVEGIEYPIRGGSCTSTYPDDVDVFIGFDHGMRQGYRGFPWNEGTDIHYPIIDRSVPTSIKSFKQMLGWVSQRMLAGDRVFCGCIGGHGRTGLFLAALTKFMNGDKDAITTVRKNYCTKAVESVSQVDWLVKHFGINEVFGSDGFKPKVVTSGKWFPGSTDNPISLDPLDNINHKRVDGKVTTGVTTMYYPLDEGSCFHGHK